MTKKTSLFITLLLLAATFNSHSMEQQSPQWTAVVGDIILGTASLTILSQPNEPFEFTALPPEIQDKIIQLLSLNTTATSLKEAAKTINSLAQVNKELNQQINDPQFCLRIIKHLAQKFNCSDQEAAKTLQTQEAKRRFYLQNQLYIRCSTPFGAPYPQNPSSLDLDFLLSQGVDLNFTYNTRTPKLFYTPLMITISNDSFMVGDFCVHGRNLINLNQRNTLNGDTALIQSVKKRSSRSVLYLLEEGADPELANFAGQTPLELAAQLYHLTQHRSYKKIFDLIQKEINIYFIQNAINNKRVNQRNNKGQTALLLAVTTPWSRVVKTILDAGADPELADDEGLTPLAAAQQTGNQKVIDLIQDAIDKKHGYK